MSQVTIPAEGDYIKDPNSTEIVEVDIWDDILPVGATIASYAATVSLVRYTGDSVADAAAAASLTKSAEVVDSTGRKTQVRLTGGTLGARYVVTNRATLADGQIIEKSFFVFMENK